MDRRLAIVLGIIAVQIALLAATLRIPGFGEPIWHHAATLGFTLAACALFWRPLTASRRFLAFGVLGFTILATASGFWLLYWKEGLRVDGLQDWGRAWHVIWSWFAMIFFFQHTWVNGAAYLAFARRTLRTIPSRIIHLGSYVLVLVAFLVTWSALGRDWFTNDNYIPLSLYAWLVFAVPPYLVWGYVRTGLAARGGEAMRRLFARGHVHVAFSVALVPVAALAILSGIPLTFFDGPLGDAGLKYVSKYWHVWPSVLFAVLVFGHALHSWNGVRAHWRSYAAAPTQIPDAASPLTAARSARLTTRGAGRARR